MKKILFYTVIMLIFSIEASTQVKVKLPYDFIITQMQDANLALEKLNDLIRKQPIKKGTNLYNGVTIRFFDRGRGRYYYFSDIIDIDITVIDYGSSWQIRFKSKSTGASDYLRFKDKKMAEEAYSSLICLMGYNANGLVKIEYNIDKRKHR